MAIKINTNEPIQPLTNDQLYPKTKAETTTDLRQASDPGFTSLSALTESGINEAIAGVPDQTVRSSLQAQKSYTDYLKDRRMAFEGSIKSGEIGRNIAETKDLSRIPAGLNPITVGQLGVNMQDQADVMRDNLLTAEQGALGTLLDALYLVQSQKDEAEQTAKAKQSVINEVLNYSTGLKELDQLSDDALTMVRELSGSEIDMGEGIGKITIRKPLTAEDEKAVDQATTMESRARNVLAVIEQIESGQLTGKDAQDALETTASVWAQSQFDVGGANLTENEMALLQPAYPSFERRAPNVIQRMLGIVPPQTEKLLDSPEELKTKALIAVGNAQQIKARVNGQEIPGIADELKRYKQQLDRNDRSAVQKALQGGYTLVVRPIVNGIKGYAELLGTTAGAIALPTISKYSPSMGKSLEDILRPVVENKYATPSQALITGGLQTVGGVGATFDILTLGAGSLPKQALKMTARNALINGTLYGTGEALKSYRTGDVNNMSENVFNGITGQSTIGIFQGAFGENETTKTADIATAIVLPIVGQKLVERVINGKAVQDIDQVQYEKNVRQSLNSTAKDVRGRVETNLVKLSAKDKNSVAKTEQLIDDAIMVTKAKTVRGMAKEMPKLSKSAGDYIDFRINDLDGTQSWSGEFIKSEILKKASSTTAGQTSAKQLTKLQEVLDGLIPNGVVYGSDLNNARKALNLEVKSNWFANGQPLTSEAEILTSLKWTGSSVLRDTITTTPGYADVGNAISTQHIAKSAEPILSRTALSGTSTGGNWLTAFINLFRNTFDAVWTPVKLEVLRRTGDQTAISKLAQMLGTQ